MVSGPKARDRSGHHATRYAQPGEFVRLAEAPMEMATEFPEHESLLLLLGLRTPLKVGSVSFRARFYFGRKRYLTMWTAAEEVETRPIS